MRKLVLLCLLFCSLVGSAQTNTNKQRHQGIRPPLIHNDSILNRVLEQKDSGLKQLQIKEDQERMERNLNSYTRKHGTNETRNALLRIGFGIALLIVLIIGLRRKRKK